MAVPCSAPGLFSLKFEEYEELCTPGWTPRELATSSAPYPSSSTSVPTAPGTRQSCPPPDLAMLNCTLIWARPVLFLLSEICLPCLQGSVSRSLPVHPRRSLTHSLILPKHGGSFVRHFPKAPSYPCDAPHTVRCVCQGDPRGPLAPQPECLRVSTA